MDLCCEFLCFLWVQLPLIIFIRWFWICYQSSELNKSTRITAPKIERYHNAKFVVSSGTTDCHNDNLWSHQWKQSWHHNNSLFSVKCQVCWLIWEMTEIIKITVSGVIFFIILILCSSTLYIKHTLNMCVYIYDRTLIFYNTQWQPYEISRSDIFLGHICHFNCKCN